MSKRKAIPLSTKLAAALACLLPQAERDFLRAGMNGCISPKDVIAKFNFDHIIPHADGGSDEWWNLDPLVIAAHEEKTAKIDIPRIAKGKRLRAAELAHSAKMLSLLYGTTPDTTKRPRPKQKLQSRPFRGKAPKDKRPPLTKTVPRRLTPA